MADFVQHCVADLLNERLAVGRDVLQIPLEQKNAIGKVPVTPLDGLSYVESQIVESRARLHQLQPRHVFDSDLDILEIFCKFLGQQTERLLDDAFERLRGEAKRFLEVVRSELRRSLEAPISSFDPASLGLNEAQNVVGVGPVGLELDRAPRRSEGVVHPR